MQMTRHCGCVLLLSGMLSSSAYAGILGGGSSNVEGPDTIKAGSPVIVKLIVYVWGNGSPIKNRFTHLSLHYRLEGEDSYKSLTPEASTVPDNWKNWVKADPAHKRECEAFTFTIPPYAPSATGTIEYYVDKTFDGYVQKATLRKIKILQ
jgi:hypothetical protein